MNYLPTLHAPVRRQLLLLYLASNFQAIGALLAQEDNDGNEQLIYYVSKTFKDTETKYFLAHQILLVTKSHPTKALLH